MQIHHDTKIVTKPSASMLDTDLKRKRSTINHSSDTPSPPANPAIHNDKCVSFTLQANNNDQPLEEGDVSTVPLLIGTSIGKADPAHKYANVDYSPGGIQALCQGPQ